MFEEFLSLDSHYGYSHFRRSGWLMVQYFSGVSESVFFVDGEFFLEAVNVLLVGV